jgi:Fe-S-cluster-containing hydrogenase component 2
VSWRTALTGMKGSRCQPYLCGNLCGKLQLSYERRREVTMGKVESSVQGEAWDPGIVGLKCFALPVSVPLAKGVIRVNPELCIGCMVCVQTCALANYGVGSFELSNMRVLSVSRYDYDAYAAPCEQCTDPLCLRYCPVSAIYVDETTGARVIDQDACIGCQECIRRCPQEPARVTYNPETMKSGKCNLCNGSPECVQACPTGALVYETNPRGIKTGFTQPEGSFKNVSC